MRIIRGKYGRRRFDVPTNISARPTTDFARENIFNVLENLVDFEGLRALDLFAGTGAISFDSDKDTIVRDDNKCLRCSICYQSCPFGAINYFLAKFNQTS